MENINSETIHKIVTKLVGEIDPVGCSSVDPKRFENLEIMMKVVDKLISDISGVSFHNQTAHQASILKAKDKVDSYLDALGDELCDQGM